MFGYDDLLSMTSDGNTLYTKGTVSDDIHTCPASTACTSPGVISGTSGVSAQFRVYGGSLYWRALGGIYACAASSCGPTTFVLAYDADVTGKLGRGWQCRMVRPPLKYSAPAAALA